MYLVTRKNRVIDYCAEGYQYVGDVVVCDSKGLNFENATIVNIGDKEIPPDIDSLAYDYIQGEFIKHTPIKKAHKELEKFKVGDVVSTYKDPGDNWLKCDGSIFDPEEYPELAEVCPEKSDLFSKWRTATYGGSGYSIISLDVVGDFQFLLVSSGGGDYLEVCDSSSGFRESIGGWYVSYSIYPVYDAFITFIEGTYILLISRENEDIYEDQDLEVWTCTYDHDTSTWSGWEKVNEITTYKEVRIHNLIKNSEGYTILLTYGFSIYEISLKSLEEENTSWGYFVGYLKSPTAAGSGGEMIWYNYCNGYHTFLSVYYNSKDGLYTHRITYADNLLSTWSYYDFDIPFNYTPTDVWSQEPMATSHIQYNEEEGIWYFLFYYRKYSRDTEEDYYSGVVYTEDITDSSSWKATALNKGFVYDRRIISVLDAGASSTCIGLTNYTGNVEGGTQLTLMKSLKDSTTWETLVTNEISFSSTLYSNRWVCNDPPAIKGGRAMYATATGALEIPIHILPEITKDSTDTYIKAKS